MHSEWWVAFPHGRQTPGPQPTPGLLSRTQTKTKTKTGAPHADRVSVVCRVQPSGGSSTDPNADGCRRSRLGRSMRGTRIGAIE